MEIIFYHPFFDANQWIQGMQQRLPNINIRQWKRGDNQHADYAMVWLPPYEMLANRSGLKGIFALGAGVEAILKQEQQKPGTLPAGVPLMRLEDAGMGLQMKEYAVATVLHYLRRMDEYKLQQGLRVWKQFEPHDRKDFVVGVLGAGVLGSDVAETLAEWGLAVRCWSRTPKQINKVESFHGKDQLGDFLSGSKVLINLLPDTPKTRGILNLSLFSQLKPGSYLINIARGSHLIEHDLLVAINKGYISGASLDVFVEEPLPEMHPFWTHPRITVTPHVAAITIPDIAMNTISENIQRIEKGELPTGVVDMELGY
ncbi:glyoxylate/hydroxypyruvate reductase GhrA [Photorhabdus heterorhabditis]|uniref:Glyoxylate/hydroxypyruvate reductase A n=1 Tax=Photorhabdus heterorhabditis TaxID=880156 RepID=A0A5B0VYC0_9GAMM|nr:glyoxylate/hydroxypyruvate reductase GhrA [Photorhabdus heterorhabditis]KAA1179730.1 glyoxylate/hydroxypyruvate reductase GhrA [Photorhabdus heterorhabditis]MBS9443390.1 glyoxylate/hydroxypyruvate reductase GhrA [Photorhabdus heterorhabditis]NRN29718.1 glyoxylate/hydroxypyruvate reductase GhrA [Photorhabdus heterorhabditis subsp. aluminescens]